jgi:LmbE family N-acetylglucosaminyl deacetylase
LQLENLNDITPRHRHIFLSPHFDDAIFACGGTMGVQVSAGVRPLILTVFGGLPTTSQEISPYALEVHREVGFDRDIANAVTTRRQEDALAAASLSADYLWLDYLDAIYRGTPTYYNSREELIGGAVHRGDFELDKQLAQTLVELHHRLPDTVWYAPLGIGRHVDHQIISSVADRLVQAGADVKFYEDFPYVLEGNELENRLKELGYNMEPALVEVSEMLPLRQEASALYSSQVNNLFGSKAEMFKSMASYAHSLRPIETVHLERYWTVR